MNIYLLDINKSIINQWNLYFGDCSDVKIVNMYLDDFLNTYDVDCVVSPANSYGIMDGGFDAAISDYFGCDLMKVVQDKIIKECYGEQIVGTSIIVDIPRSDKKLIHTPSMRIPSRIKDPMVIYYCMRSTLMLALDSGIKNIVIPAFGGSCGGVNANVIAYMMKEAYKQVMNHKNEISWVNLKKDLENKCY